MEVKRRRTTTVYVDGFNLYYGALKGSQYKWLNLSALLEHVLPHNEVVQIRYFTARVDGISATRQDVYLRALRTIPDLTIHEGHFLKTRALMPLAVRKPGLPMVKNHFKLPVGVLNPQLHNPISRVLRGQASFTRELREGHLAAAQFDPEVTDAAGRTIRKPSDW